MTNFYSDDFLKSFSTLKSTVPAYYHYKTRNLPYMDFLQASILSKKEHMTLPGKPKLKLVTPVLSPKQRKLQTFVQNSKRYKQQQKVMEATKALNKVFNKGRN